MAREIKDIIEAIKEKKAELFPQLSGSEFAEWLKLAEITAAGIADFELILDNTEARINELVATKQPGVVDWYAQIAYDFQLGDSLAVNENHLLVYPVIDESKKIIKQAASDEVVTDGKAVIEVKVAKETDGELVPLSAEEKLLVEGYYEKKKYAGASVNVVSIAADIVKYTVDVYYNKELLRSEVNNSLESTRTNFRNGIGYDGVFYKSDFVIALNKTEGVITTKINLLTGESDGAVEPIDVLRKLKAGYFNWDENSSFNLIAS